MPQARRAAAPMRRRAAPVRRAPPRQRQAPIRQPAMRAPAKRNMSAANAFRGAGSGVGSALGSVLGGPAGGAIGGMLGRGAGAILSKIFGHGEYQVSNTQGIKENSLVVANAANIPEFGTGRVAVKFKHREFLGDVISSGTVGAFKINSYSLNPGLNRTFPWLSQVVGSSFQQHRINGMTFEFRSMSADALNSTNTALGSVVMATDYDSPDTEFTSKQQMENTEYGVSCKPSVNMMHAIECARAQTPVSELYIRAFDNPPNTDLRLYDLGRFSIATVGCQAANVNLGELWVTYDIDAFKAIEQPPGYIIPGADYIITQGTADLKTSLDADPFGNSSKPGYAVIDQIGLAVGGHTVVFPYSLPPQIQFNVSYICFGDSTALTLGTVVGSNGLDCATQYKMDDATATRAVWTCKAYYDGTGTAAAPPTLTFAGTTLPANVTFAELSVSQIAYAVPGPG